MPDLDETAVFRAAQQIESPEEREAYVRQTCGANWELYEQITAMLRAYDAEPAFLESPPVGLGLQPDIAPISEGPGTVIGRYKLLELIGEGGFAVVYMAEQTEPIRRQVALKIIKLGMDTRQVIARFEAERQALALMDHPGIAKVYDAGATETGRPYFVMQLIRGTPITQYCDENRLTAEARLRLFLDVCRAVQHAHQKGIIHRDIKPTNVLVALHDGTPVPKVIDFGIAKAVHQRLTEKTLYTSYRQIIGTPQYMSPEQAEFSDLDVDTRSDIYSLGVLLYELLTSTTPLAHDDLERMGYDEICHTIRHSEPPTPSRRLSTLGNAATAAHNRQTDPAGLRRLLHNDLDWIVMKALEIDRTRRYESADALAADIQRHLANEPIEAKRGSTIYMLRKFFLRYKVPVALGATLVVLVTSVAVVMSLMYGTQRRLTGEAIAQQKHAEAAERTASTARRQAELAEAEARRLLYISDMNAAGHAWEQNDIGVFEHILTSLESNSKPGLRDFGLRYLLYQYEAFKNTPRLSIDAKSAVVFSPDGMMLAVSHTHGRVTLWHKLPDGWRKGDTFGEEDTSRWYTSVAFSPENEGRDLLAYPIQDTIRLRDVTSGEEYALPKGHVGAVWDVAFSSDGQLLASGGADTKVVLWDVASRSIKQILTGHTGTVRTVAFSPTEPLVASGGEDNTIRLWHYRENDQSQELRRHSDAVWAVEFSPNGAFLASASADKTAVVWDLKRKTAVTLYGHRDEVRSIAWSPNQEFLATGSRDRTTKLWGLASYDEIATIRGTSNYSNCIAFAPSGETLACSGPDRDVLLWNVGEMVRTDLLHLPGNVRMDAPSLNFLPGTAAELVVSCTLGAGSTASTTGDLSNVLLSWKPENGDVRRHDLLRSISALAVSGDGTMLAAAQDDSTIQLWALPFTNRLRPIANLRLGDNFAEVSALAFSSDSQLVIAGTMHGQLAAWDIRAKRIVFHHKHGHAGRVVQSCVLREVT